MNMPPHSALGALSPSQLAAMFDCIPTRIALLDADGRYRYVNPAYADFARLPLGDIVGRTPPDILGDSVLAAVGSQDSACAAEWNRKPA
jgi:PAS domain-containing protein